MKRVEPVYKRVFFDRTLLVGLIFMALAYIMRGTWVGTFSEAIAFMIGILWSFRAATTNPHVVFRLLATLMLVMIGSLLAFYLGSVNGLL